MYLVDIGNRYAHLSMGNRVVNLEYETLFKEYKDKRLYYINVNPNLKEELKKNRNWIDLEEYIKLDGTYKGMGVDRKALLLSRGDGVYIDAGSAITIDLKRDNRFIGGTILLGIWKQKSAYKEISSVLEVSNLEELNLNTLPNTNTKESISYGIIAPIVALIEKINKDNLPIYITGGDGRLLASYIKNSQYIDNLIFEGLKRVAKSYNKEIDFKRANKE